MCLTNMENEMMFNEITVSDLQSKHSKGESVDTKIRKSWSLQMTDDVKQKFINLPKEVKTQLYKSFDSDVQKIWTELLKESNENALKNGAKRINTGSGIHFDHEYCKDVDELLIQAAQKFIIQFASTDMKG